jgi:AraC-like DNA-binding protein
MAGTQTVGAIQVLQLLEAWEELGLDREALRRAARLGSKPLDDGRLRLPWRCVPALFSEAQRQSGDPLIGLRAGLATRSRGLPAYLSRSSANVEEGLRHYARLSRNAADPLRVALDVGPTHASVRLELASARALPAILEYVVGALIGFLSEPLGGLFQPSGVRFPHRARRPVADYERLLGGPVRFREPACRLTFERSVLGFPMPTANPLVAQVIGEEIRRERRAAEAASLRTRVARAIEELVHGREGADGRRVARFLGVSARTLQRGLEREGTSFRETREGVLRELAAELLADPEIPIAEIAVRLGFADAAAFGKAFRRWTGETPSSQRHRSQPRPTSPPQARDRRPPPPGARGAARPSGPRPPRRRPTC